MITIKNLKKEYKNQQVLKSISLSLPNKGIIAIKGPSGCGKTTLLNCIAGLIPFNGQIKIDNVEIKENNEEENAKYRLANIGLVFQDFKLFENETVLENILFPLETLTNLDEEKKRIKCGELLKLVGLSRKEKQYVSTLSGGEKQRVCIARSLVNDPKIILADEPTGALDEISGVQIMNILEKISNKSLVILVTHDDSLATTYGDKVIEIKDGEVVSIKENKHSSHLIDVPLLKNGNNKKKPCISNVFLIKHSLHSLLRKRIRSFICTGITSIGLIGIGLSLSISSIISKNVKEAYSSLIKKDQIIITSKKKDNFILGEYAGSFVEAQYIKEKYSEYIEDIGVNYQADFEDIFCDSNELVINNGAIKNKIQGISARNINEYEWLDLIDKTFYPNKIDKLKDDEICLGLSNTHIQEICLALRIERTIDSLSKYIENNDISLVFNFEHADWEYFDQQVVTLKGFTLENETKIYHTNHRWNEYMFEERMRLPSEDSLTSESFYPWTLKKSPYFYLNDNIDTFLTYTLTDYELSSYLFEIGQTKHFPLLYKNVEIDERRRVLFLSNTTETISLDHLKYFEEHVPNLKDPILGGSQGIVIYPNSLMMGFSENTFISFDISKLNDAIDVETSINLEEGQSIEYPEEIITGHFAKPQSNSLNFSIQNNLLSGEIAKTYDEIVISKALAKYIKGNPIGETLYFSFPISNMSLSGADKNKIYKIVGLKVTGVVESSDYVIYHDRYWPILFFQTRIGLSIYNLKTRSISYSLDNKSNVSDSISRLNKGFPYFDIINPLKDINSSIDEMSNYVSITALIFSLFASITSILLLGICSYLHVFESRKEIGLARSIGINKKESNKFIYAHSLTLCLISFIVSSIELLIVSIVISLEMTGKILLSLSIFPFAMMLLLAVSIALINAKFISLSISKNNSIEISKY